MSYDEAFHLVAILAVLGIALWIVELLFEPNREDDPFKDDNDRGFW